MAPDHWGVMETAQTRTVRARYGIPSTFDLVVEDGVVLVYLPAHVEAVRRAAFAPETLPLAGVGGRAPLRVVTSGGRRLLVRPYRKGGLLRHLRGRTFRGAWRPLQELTLHHALQAQSVPVPEVVGAVVHHSARGWQGALLTGEVARSVDLEAWLHGARSDAPADRETILQRAGRTVRLLHDAGVWHADLHAKNLLLTAEGEVWILDLDRARAFDAPLSEAMRLENLLRMGRGIQKHRLKGMRVDRNDARVFLAGYAGDAQGAEQWLTRIERRLGRGLSLRTLWWRLGGQAKPWSPARTTEESQA